MHQAKHSKMDGVSLSSGFTSGFTSSVTIGYAVSNGGFMGAKRKVVDT